MKKPKLPPENEQIVEATETIAKIIEQRRDQAKISPSWVATEAMAKLHAAWMLRSRDYPTVYRLAHLQCRQIARELLRHYYEPEGEIPAPAQDSLFPVLQDRYPAAPSAREDEPVYIQRDLLTEADWKYNVDRMTKEIASKTAHRDAFKAWGEKRFGKRSKKARASQAA